MKEKNLEKGKIDHQIVFYKSNYTRWTVLVLIITIFAIYVLTREDSERIPVIIIPGFGGSQAFATPKNSSAPFLVWLNIYYLFDPSYLDYYFSLEFNPETNQTYDGPHADIQFPGWGSTETIENLDTTTHSSTRYFSPLVQNLVLDKYFVRNKTLRGTPYDFRKAPYENTNVLEDIKTLIEETVEATRSKVAILAHSMGVMYSLRFFELVTDEWKSKHIKMFIATSGPYGGSVKTMKIEASGDNLGVYAVSPFKFRPVQRSLPSTAFLLPNPDVFPSSKPIIITPEKNYSSTDYKEFFKDISYQNPYTFYELSRNFFPLQQPSGVDEIYCIYGTEIDTMRQIVYSPPSTIYGQFPDQNPTLVYGDGDGTVNIESLTVCKKWTNTKVIELPKAEHLQIIGDNRYVNIVCELLGSKSMSLTVQRWTRQFSDYIYQSFIQPE